MRACPVCDGKNEKTICQDYWKASSLPTFYLFECQDCGHRYIVNPHIDQDWFDNYYLNQYKTDDEIYSNSRLNNLALVVRQYCLGQRVLDIGGMDGELEQRLSNYEVFCDVAGIGQTEGTDYSAVILSHTLEHVYDVPAMFGRIRKALSPDGLLFIEVPVHIGYTPDPKEYDYHWQHVNKFRPFDLEYLLSRYGFSIEQSYQVDDYREYKCWRVIAYESSR